jgi:hypothetical protein
VPFCPTLASSWNLISTGVPAVVPSRACFSREAKFFKSLLGRRVFFRVIRPRFQTGQLKLAQPLANRAFVDGDRKPAGDFAAQIDTTPTDDFILVEIGTSNNQFA